jgi:hypothetical protein
MPVPHSQWFVRLIAWTVGGAVAVGALLDALLNAGELFTFRATLWFSVIVCAIWFSVELILKKRSTRWGTTAPAMAPVTLTRLGPRSRAAVIGVLLLPWSAQVVRELREQHGPRAMSTPLQAAPVPEVGDRLTVDCHARPSFVMGVGPTRLGVADDLKKDIVIDCDLANVGRDRLSIVYGELAVDYHAPSGSTIPLQPGSQLDDRAPLPDLPLVLDAGEVHRFALSVIVIRDKPDHVPVMVIETPKSGALLFPSTWRTKYGLDGRLHRVEQHYLSGLTLSFTTARRVIARQSVTLAELERTQHGGLTSR